MTELKLVSALPVFAAILTVGDLRKALVGLSDDLPVSLEIDAPENTRSRASVPASH